jgi:NhaC family Na+:H+ antiporter
MTTPKSPSLLDALIPIAALVMMLALSVYLFGSDSSYGPNQTNGSTCRGRWSPASAPR